ncbi:MAG: heme-binding protein [Acidobacteriota bacterium]
MIRRHWWLTLLILIIALSSLLWTLAQQRTSRGRLSSDSVRMRPHGPPQAVLPECSDFPLDPDGLTSGEVLSIVAAAAEAIDAAGFSVAVVDRPGRILAVWEKGGSSQENSERAVALARTGAFFSNDQAPLSSRTVRSISQKNFPPGIDFLPNGALYGIENTNRGCSFNSTFIPGQCIPRATSLAALRRANGVDGCAGCPPLRCDGVEQTGCGLGVYTGKFSGRFEEGRLLDLPEAELLDEFPQQVHGGGIPLFKDCRLVGGVGVFGAPADQAEFAAVAASLSLFDFRVCLPPPFAVFLDGIRLPFAENTTPPPGSSAGPGLAAGEFVVLDEEMSAPVTVREGRAAAEGWLIGPLASPDLSVDEVGQIVQQSVDQADRTRAAIRLPLGSRTRMVISVAALDGTTLGLFRMPDATLFSVDVALAKARNMAYFSDPEAVGELSGVPAGTAVTNRTISFGSQPLFPVGITGSERGPFFGLFEFDLQNPCSQGRDPGNLFDALNKAGVVFFPGSVPLYRNGQLVGGLGISGDGVEQDDVVAAGGAAGFEAPEDIRADQIFIRRVRLPYLKFNRNPEK